MSTELVIASGGPPIRSAPSSYACMHASSAMQEKQRAPAGGAGFQGMDDKSWTPGKLKQSTEVAMKVIMMFQRTMRLLSPEMSGYSGRR